LDSNGRDADNVTYLGATEVKPAQMPVCFER